MSTERFRSWGKIGGLTAWSRHDADRMLGSARKAFAERFENEVDPDRSLPPAERARRADRARRAYMLKLAQKSAQVRRQKKATPAGSSAKVAEENVGDSDEPRSRA